jgi:glyoxylase-like metal-dependent hydrolase (beta-lactamase superfamily II)
MMKKSALSPICLVDKITNSNCYILADTSSALIIDPNHFPSIEACLKERHLKPDWVLLTHEHCDHISGLNELRSHYTTKVLASSSCSAGIQSTTINMTRIMESYLYFKSNGKVLTSYPKFTCNPADVTFQTSYYFRWKSHEFSITSAPGHTPGSVCIIVDNSALFSGDYFIPGEEVITRLPGGDEEAYEKYGKDALRALPDPILTYPGHGKPFVLTKEVKRNYGL